MGFFGFLFGREPAGTSDKSSASMPSAAGGRPMTRARLIFLSKFNAARILNSDSFNYLETDLGEAPSRVIAQFVSADLIEPASLADKVAHFFSASQLKELLRSHALPVSGTKAVAVEKLLQADAAGMATLVANVTAYICTDKGHVIVDQFKASEIARYQVAEQLTLAKLRAGDIPGAVDAAAAYGKESVGHNPIAIVLSREDNLRLTKLIFHCRPKLLKGLTTGDWEIAHVASAMTFLFGSRSAKPWLPATFGVNGNLDPDVAIRMIWFAAKTLWDLDRFREVGVRTVRVSGCGSASCPQCQAISGKKFPIAAAVELPYEHCTCELGCRCLYVLGDFKFSG
jgi:hypothetical protein